MSYLVLHYCTTNHVSLYLVLFCFKSSCCYKNGLLEICLNRLQEAVQGYLLSDNLQVSSNKSFWKFWRTSMVELFCKFYFNKYYNSNLLPRWFMGSLKFCRYFSEWIFKTEPTLYIDVLRNKRAENVQQIYWQYLQRSEIFVKLVCFYVSNITINKLCCGRFPGNSSKIFKTAIW